MGKREAYNKCMSSFIRGTGKTKEQRQNDFCIGAKVCSKNVSREEAARLCAEAALNPKPPKPNRTRGKCRIDVATLSACVLKAIDGTEITLATLTASIASCTGQKVEKSTRERFIKKCFKENAVTGDIKEAQKLRSMCTAKWKEQEAL